MILHPLLLFYNDSVCMTIIADVSKSQFFPTMHIDRKCEWQMWLICVHEKTATHEQHAVENPSMQPAYHTTLHSVAAVSFKTMHGQYHHKSMYSDRDTT